MDPDSQTGEEDIGDDCAKDTEDHDVREVLEESLSAHVVAWSEDNRRNTEVEEHIVVEDDVLLDHVVVRAVSCQTDQESDERDVTRFVTESNVTRWLLLSNDVENQNHTEDQKRACLYGLGGCFISHPIFIFVKKDTFE